MISIGSRLAREAGRRILNEGEAISHALGCRPELDVEKIIRTMQTLEHKSSALQDLERGRPVEMDSLFVVPLEMARMLGVATPTLDLLTALVRLRLRSAGLYEDLAYQSRSAKRTGLRGCPYRQLNPDILTVQSTKDGPGLDAPHAQGAQKESFLPRQVRSNSIVIIHVV